MSGGGGRGFKKNHGDLELSDFGHFEKGYA